MTIKLININILYLGINRVFKYLKIPFYIYEYIIFLSLQNYRKKLFNITAQDVFIVTSCTNPFDRSSAVNHNLSDSQDNRFSGLISTFKSIREYYPDAIIVNLENSNIDEDLSQKIIDACNFSFNYSDDKLIKYSRKFSNKGMPWSSKIIKFLNEVGDTLNATNIHFLVGRYEISSNEINKNSTIEGAFFRYYDQLGVVSTRYFLFRRIHPKTIVKYLNSCIWPMIMGKSIEECIIKKIDCPIYKLKHIGITGLVNGLEAIKE